MLDWLKSFRRPEIFLLGRIDKPPLEFEGKKVAEYLNYHLFLTKKGNWVVAYSEKNTDAFWVDKIEDIWDIAKNRRLNLDNIANLLKTAQKPERIL